jgi:hypothetical protein
MDGIKDGISKNLIKNLGLLRVQSTIYVLILNTVVNRMELLLRNGLGTKGLINFGI